MTTVPAAGDAELAPTVAEQDALVERLNAQPGYFSDQIMAHRTEADSDLIDQLRKDRKDAAARIEADAARIAAANAELNVWQMQLAAANERADENWKLAEEERHDANHWHAECEALSARLAEAEREATEDRRLIGDLRARIATLTDLLRRAWRDDPGWLADADAALNPEEPTNGQ